MRKILSVSILIASCSGCAATSLQQYTLNQAMTVSDMRYKQVMHDLAVIADNSGNLPSFALTAGGTANMTNTVSVDTATLWDQAVKGFSKETLAALGQHNPELQWTLDPVVSEPQLEALGYACMWAVYGPPPLDSRAMEVLRALNLHDLLDCPPPGTVKRPPGYHFGVTEQLYKIPPGWLHVGDKNCIPKHAVYRATHGNAGVWVDKNGLASLSEFTLVILDIATIDSKSLIIPTPSVSVVLTKKKPSAAAPAISGTFSTNPPAGTSATTGTFRTDNPPGTPASSVKFVTEKGDEKVTENWDACQIVDGCVAGEISLSRPRSISQKILEFPCITESQFSVAPTQVRPLFKVFQALGLPATPEVNAPPSVLPPIEP